jgi:hypothetical protein
LVKSVVSTYFGVPVHHAMALKTSISEIESNFRWLAALWRPLASELRPGAPLLSVADSRALWCVSGTT